MSGIPFPEDDYLILIGKFAYAVGYVEEMLIGDVGHLPGLPPSLSVQELSGKTTRQLATTVDASIARISDPDVVEYLQTCSAALKELSDLRNHMLHARPATADDGFQRLYRWRSSQGATDTFLITNEWIEEAIGAADLALGRIYAVRPEVPQ